MACCLVLNVFPSPEASFPEKGFLYTLSASTLRIPLSSRAVIAVFDTLSFPVISFSGSSSASISSVRSLAWAFLFFLNASERSALASSFDTARITFLFSV